MAMIVAVRRPRRGGLRARLGARPRRTRERGRCRGRRAPGARRSLIVLAVAGVLVALRRPACASGTRRVAAGARRVRARARVAPGHRSAGAARTPAMPPAVAAQPLRRREPHRRPARGHRRAARRLRVGRPAARLRRAAQPRQGDRRGGDRRDVSALLSGPGSCAWRAASRPSARRASASRSAPSSPPTCTTRSCRRSR